MTIDVLVTGVTGFVGGALAQAMVRDGRFRVRGAVRGPSATIPDGVRRVTGDLSTDTDWRDALQGVQVVVHCAARVHVMREQAADPLAQFRRVNVDGTLALARQAAAAGVRRFVFLSSVKVLGEATLPGQPLRQDAPPAPQDAYGQSKHEAEAALQRLAATAAMEVVIVRPPLVYGPGVKGNFASLVRWVRRGTPLPLGAASANRRSLVALDNLVSLLVLCADPARSPAAAGRSLLVSDGEDRSTACLVRSVAKAYGRRAWLVPVPVPLLRWGAALLGRPAAADRLLGSLQVDNSGVEHLLGWKPAVTMDEQLRKMAEHDARM